MAQVAALVLDDTEAGTARRCGATVTVTDPDRLTELHERERPTLCFDTVGGAALNAIVHVIADEGRMVNISSPGDGLATVDLHELLRRQLTLRGLGTRSYDAVRGAHVLEILGEGFEAAPRRPPTLAAPLPLARAADAYALVSTHPPGKVALTMGPSP